MVHSSRLVTVFLLTAISVRASPFGLFVRATPENTVAITSEKDYCLIVPLNPHDDIGNSERPGGTTSYCAGSEVTSQDRMMPADFWSNVALVSVPGRYTQLTGCIRPGTLDRLNANDAGGQYDSSGGSGGRGNPQDSVCKNFNHYVELIEPAGNRACIRCCMDADDCPTNKDTSGCPNVIPGNYFDCD